MNCKGRSTSRTALLTGCAAAAILVAGCPAKAQECPTGTNVPTQTIKIFNDTAQYLFIEIEMGTNNPDRWIQEICNLPESKTGTDRYAETRNNRFYINPSSGIAPGRNVQIELPLYTQIAATVDPTAPDQYADWWQGQTMQIFTSPTSTPPAAYQNAFHGKSRPDQEKLLSKASNPTFPSCKVGAGIGPCTLAFFSDTGTLGKNGPSQLVEATLGAEQDRPPPLNGAMPKFLNTKQIDIDVSYVDVAYIGLAMGPYKNDQIGYIGSDIKPAPFRTVLNQFQQTFSWPRYIDITGTNTQIPKLPSTLGLIATLSGAHKPEELPPLTRWPTNVWAPIQNIRNNWNTYSSTCTHSPQGFTTFCDAILDVRDLIAANYNQYRAVFRKNNCSGTPVGQTRDLTLSHLYGWTPWIESQNGCIKPKDNLLQNTPGYELNNYRLFTKVKVEFDNLNYGTYENPPYNFNPWVQFIHGDATKQGQLGIANAYAFSVDDAVGNLNVEASGYIIDVGSLAHLENRLPAEPPIDISLGYDPKAAVKFVSYGVCSNEKGRQKPVNPAFPSFVISPNEPQNCPVYLTDNNNQTYTFTVTKPPPFTKIPTADVEKVPSDARWSSGGGNPTRYNTTSIIDCSGNTSKLAKLWCCTLLPGNGSGVFAFSTPIVPPSPHQLLANTVVTNPATDQTSDLPTCNMGKIGMKQ